MALTVFCNSPFPSVMFLQSPGVTVFSYPILSVTVNSQGLFVYSVPALPPMQQPLFSLKGCMSGMFCYKQHISELFKNTLWTREIAQKCFYNKLGFSYQLPRRDSQPSITLVPKDPLSSPDLFRHKEYAYVQAKHIRSK